MKVFQDTPHEFYMDGYEKTNLDTGKKVVKKDWDMIFVYDGDEGSGKSLKAMQSAFYCYPELSMKNYAFNPVQFRDVILKAKQYEAVVYDEAYSGLSSRGTMSKINKSIVGMLTEIRQKNLFVFIVLPCFFDLDKYVALWRSRALFHIYTSDGFERGYFAFYNKDRKKDLYLKGKKLYDYKQGKPNFRGRFTNHYPIDEQTYRKAKYDALKDRSQPKTDEDDMQKWQEITWRRLMDIDDVTHVKKAEILNMPTSTYFMRLRKWRENI